MAHPYFSIIVPMYNREKFIARTLQSCLKQSFEDFELIVVDDCSTDNSVKVVQGIRDSRIKLIQHTVNQERLIARNNGARASYGEWIIWLDSDDELVPDALAIMKQRIGELPPDVLALRFMCRLDSGYISPDPPYSDEIWDYEGYIRWIESHQGKWSETMPVVNKRTIQFVLFPEDRLFTGEMQYHLDIASKYKVRACMDIVRLYHFDADNNMWNPDIVKMLNAAAAFAARLESIISVHGMYIERWAPNTYQILFAGLFTQLLFARHRKKAWKMFLHNLDKLTFRLFIIIFLGTVSPILLAHAKVVHSTAFKR